MPDDAPRPEDAQRPDRNPSVAPSEVSGEEIGLLAAEAVVGQVGSGGEEPPSRVLGPLSSVPAGLWPDIPGVFFPEPYALDFEWRHGVPDAAVRAREQVQPVTPRPERDNGDRARESGRAAIDIKTGDLEFVDEAMDFFDEAEKTIEMEVEVAETEPGEDPALAETGEVPVRRSPDSIQPIEDAEMEEIVEMRHAPAEHEAISSTPARSAPPPTPPKSGVVRTIDPSRPGLAPNTPGASAASRRKPAPTKAAPPLPPDATGEKVPVDPERLLRRSDEAPKGEARTLPLEKVRSFRKLQGPRPTMAQPNLIEAALGGTDPSQAGLSGKAKPWYEAIFDDSFFNFLPKNLHRQTRREAKFAFDSLRLPEGAKVLDLACGFGRHAIELAKRGLQVTGLDLSEALIEKARQEANRRKMEIEFFRGDMRELAYEREFDGTLLLGNSFGYFDDQTNIEVLDGVRRALKPRGRFLLQMQNRDKVIRELPEVIWWRGLDCLVLEEIEFDPETSRLQSKRTVVFDDGRPPWEQFIEMRLYSLHEIYMLMEEAGFRVADVSGSFHYRGTFFVNESRDLLILTERERELL